MGPLNRKFGTGACSTGAAAPLPLLYGGRQVPFTMHLISKLVVLLILRWP